MFQKIALYLSLTKPRVMFLVIFTAIVYGTFSNDLLLNLKIFLFFAKNNQQNSILYRYFWSLSSLALACGCCGAINMAMEYKTDKKMQRTKNRPIAIGKISGKNGYIFGIFLGFLSIMIGLFVLNIKFTLVILISILLYVPLYTKLKVINVNLAIFFGSISGSLPPIIMSYGLFENIDFNSIYLFFIIFFWTLAHSYALNLWLESEYKLVNFSILIKIFNYKDVLLLICFLTFITIILMITFVNFLNYHWFFTMILQILSVRFGLAAITLLKSASVVLSNNTSQLNDAFLKKSSFVLLSPITPLKYFKISIFYLFFSCIILGLANIFKFFY